MRSVLDAFQLVPCSNSTPFGGIVTSPEHCVRPSKNSSCKELRRQRREAERRTHPYSKREKRSTEIFEAGENARSSVKTSNVARAAKKKRAGSDKAEIQ